MKWFWGALGFAVTALIAVLALLVATVADFDKIMPKWQLSVSFVNPQPLIGEPLLPDNEVFPIELVFVNSGTKPAAITSAALLYTDLITNEEYALTFTPFEAFVVEPGQVAIRILQFLNPTT